MNTKRKFLIIVLACFFAFIFISFVNILYQKEVKEMTDVEVEYTPEEMDEKIKDYYLDY